MYDACVPWPERPRGAKDKSRGPKGLELEVGARRASKLLVPNISSVLYTFTLSRPAQIVGLPRNMTSFISSESVF